MPIEDYIDLFLDVIVPADEYELYLRPLRASGGGI